MTDLRGESSTCIVAKAFIVCAIIIFQFLPAIAKQFPDLRVLDFDGSSLESTPFSSPVHQSPHSPHGAPTRLVDSDRPPYRPGVYFQPSSATTNSSYADIVRQWLKPYLDH